MSLLTCCKVLLPSCRHKQCWKFGVLKLPTSIN
jgi:hypothetical protein